MTHTPRGLKLVKAILDRATLLNLDPSDIAEMLDYTDSYWKVIARGGRWIGSIGEDKLRLIADFLELPLLTVYVLAEIFNPRDFVYRPSLEQIFSETYARLKSHGTLSVFAPSEAAWNDSPEETKLLCVYLLSRLMYDEMIDLAKDQLSTKSIGFM
jgi:hypothetical protein